MYVCVYMSAWLYFKGFNKLLYYYRIRPLTSWLRRYVIDMSFCVYHFSFYRDLGTSQIWKHFHYKYIEYHLLWCTTYFVFDSMFCDLPARWLHGMIHLFYVDFYILPKNQQASFDDVTLQVM